MTPVEPVGPVEIRPRPVEGPPAVERSPRPGKRDPRRDPNRRKPSPKPGTRRRTGTSTCASSVASRSFWTLLKFLLGRAIN
jgi:hypothetical protein